MGLADDRFAAYRIFIFGRSGCTLVFSLLLSTTREKMSAHTIAFACSAVNPLR